MKRYYKTTLEVIAKHGRVYQIRVYEIEEPSKRIARFKTVTFVKPLFFKSTTENHLISLVEEVQLRDYDVEVEDFKRCIEEYDNR